MKAFICDRCRTQAPAEKNYGYESPPKGWFQLHEIGSGTPETLLCSRSCLAQQVQELVLAADPALAPDAPTPPPAPLQEVARG